jgi:hypothetical protein
VGRYGAEYSGALKSGLAVQSDRAGRSKRLTRNRMREGGNNSKKRWLVLVRGRVAHIATGRYRMTRQTKSSATLPPGPSAALQHSTMIRYWSQK